MRISEKERLAILEVLRRHLPANMEAKILLFGSRADDSLRGGDIDIAVVINNKEIIQALNEKDYKVMAALKAHPHIGDQIIDLKFLTEEESKTAFFEQALKKAVLLDGL